MQLDHEYRIKVPVDDVEASRCTVLLLWTIVVNGARR